MAKGSKQAYRDGYEKAKEQAIKIIEQRASRVKDGMYTEKGVQAILKGLYAEVFYMKEEE